MKFIIFFLILVLFIFNFSLFAQKNLKTYQISVPKIEKEIKIDGELDDEIWKKTEKISKFYQNFPYDTSFAEAKTEVMMSYDENFVYIAAICYDTNPEINNVVQTLRRDFDPSVNDCFMVYIDTFNDQTNGFAFGVSSEGVQREGLIINGGNFGIASDWDNKWYSQSKKTKEAYIVEMAIPFKTLRFKGGGQQWKMNFARIDRKINEQSTWVPVPRNFGVTSLVFTGEANFELPLKKSGANIVVIPYLAGGQTSKYNPNDTDTKRTFTGGADVKVAVTSSLNLDLTFNPDFSQVEVDRQVTNLDRFEIFFPERRQFFLENQDMFANFGFSRIRPFFSRRIGIGLDTSTRLIVQNPIIYGARLSGKVNKDWRVGLLNMQTDTRPEAGIQGQNYTVGTFQRQVFSRSVLGGIFVNRQTTSDADNKFSMTIPDFTRIVGLDYNLGSKNNKWQGKIFYHQLLKPQNLDNQYAHASWIQYNSINWEVNWNHEFVGQNYNINDIGFVPRKNHWRFEPSIRYKLYPKNKNSTVNFHSFTIYNNTFWNTEGKLTDRYFEGSYRANFKNSAFFGFWVGNQFTYLFSSFDPTNTGGQRLLAGTEYNNMSYSAAFNSNIRKLFSYSLGVDASQYFNGNRYGYNASLNYRIQPMIVFGLGFNYNQIRLPDGYNSADLLLISPRIDFTFTRSLFFTMLAQYNNQIDNINFNARLQWRFKPVSDLFVVYTDNYFAENFKVKNRALVLKLTYWFNI